MPRYDWLCSKCTSKVEVHRSMANRLQAPDGACPRCGAVTWLRQSVYLTSRPADSANSPWPLVLPKLERDIEVRNGQPVQVRRDVVFLNQRQQEDYMKRNGLVRMLDGEDPEVGSSQHSVYDQRNPPPTDLAAQLAQKSYFIEKELVKELTHV